jgi:hypothetical protein
MRRIRAHPQLKNMTIGIISFYKAQVTRLRAACHRLPDITVIDGNENVSPVTATTVDGAQGTEYDIVLLSLVQTKTSAFLGKPHRLVVALTRARWILGIYTNWSLVDARDICGPRPNKHIRHLFKDLVSRNQVIDRQEPPANTSREDLELRIPTRARCYDCYDCDTVEHTRQNCPNIICSRCRENGHTALICPDRAVCARCGQQGHARRKCTTVINQQILAELQSNHSVTNINRASESYDADAPEDPNAIAQGG